MAVKPTLLILAAGMATRYGSLKQIDSFGPNGETIIDYSLYDAIRAGFGKVIFVIRQSIAEEFKAVMQHKFTGQIEIDFVSQELDSLPAGFSVPPNRVKPWGTAHAVWVATSKIKEPFAIINGDDFYGRESFKIIADFLQKTTTEGCLAGYCLANTISENGPVSRGICETDAAGYLTRITEQTHIEPTETGIMALQTDKNDIMLSPDQIVSMNLMGFPASILSYFENYLQQFLVAATDNPKAEFFLPGVIDKLVQAGTIRVKVLPTPEKWFGITYPADKPIAEAALRQLTASGIYPAHLESTPLAEIK